MSRDGYYIRLDLPGCRYTLTTDELRQRDAMIAEQRARGMRVVEIARYHGVRTNRVYQVLKKADGRLPDRRAEG